METCDLNLLTVLIWKPIVDEPEMMPDEISVRMEWPFCSSKLHRPVGSWWWKSEGGSRTYGSIVRENFPQGTFNAAITYYNEIHVSLNSVTERKRPIFNWRYHGAGCVLYQSGILLRVDTVHCTPSHDFHVHSSHKFPPKSVSPMKQASMLTAVIAAIGKWDDIIGQYQIAS